MSELEPSLNIRDAMPADTERMVDIYRPYVLESNSTFETEPPSVSEFQSRVDASQQKWVWLVAEMNDQLVGYAYGSAHRARAAYGHSVETSIYLDREMGGRGIGRLLYTELHRRLTEMGFCNAYAGITVPNPASVRLHLAQGYRFIGVFPRVGFKFGQWQDVAWWTKKLRDAPLENTSVEDTPRQDS